MKDRILSALLVPLLGLGAVVARGAEPPADRPNVVVFFTDDQGYGDLGCQGSTDLSTPNIDRMAAEGVRFTTWYSAAPVCSASRAAMLTGRSPQGAGVPGNVSSYPGQPGMPPAQVTIAERLKPLGYATAAVGKWHLGSAPGATPNDQGFDRFFGFYAGCVDNFSHTFYWDVPHVHDLRRDDQEVHEDGTYLTDIVTREALRFVDESRAGPFFLYVAYNLPHYPLQAPQRILKRFAHLPPSRAKYAATLAAVDESVGDVLARLDEHKIADRTLVVFLSDHGATAEARGDGPIGDNGPFRGRKFSLFEGGLRVPCIVRRPGVVPAGQTRDQLACTSDLAPTFLAAAGGAADSPAAFEGKDLAEVLLRDAPSPHASLSWSSAGQDAVREGRWKLVRNGRDDQNRPIVGPDALFLADLEADPGETRNLAVDHPEVVERLSGIHAEWTKSVAASQASDSR